MYQLTEREKLDIEFQCKIKKLLELSDDFHNIFTPFDLCQEIIDKIPERTSDTKYLVIANIEFIYVLKRSGINLDNVTFATPCSGKAFAARRIGVKDAIIYRYDHLREDFEKMPKFDVVVGNPPYSDTSSYGNRKNHSDPLWFKFVKCSIKSIHEGGYMAFVTPISWIQPSSKINKIITSRDIVDIKILPNNTFKHVGTNPSYWIIKNTIKHNDLMSLNVEGIIYKVRRQKDFLPTMIDDFSISLNILNKTVNVDNKKFNIKVGEYFASSANLRKERDLEYRYPVFHTNKVLLWSNVKKKNTSHGIPKVLFAISGTIRKAYVDIDASVTQVGAALLTDNLDQAHCALGVLKSKLYRFIIQITKTNAPIPAKLVRLLPSVDLSRDWTDQELYDHFNLTNEEIELIERTVK